MCTRALANTAVLLTQRLAFWPYTNPNSNLTLTLALALAPTDFLSDQ